MIPVSVPSADELTRDMVGIGMLFKSMASRSPNIENTLVFAARAGVDGEDFRVLAILCTWLGMHSRCVNADRLVALVKAEPSPRVRAFWAGVGHWQRKDRRFARLVDFHRGEPVDLLVTGQEFQVRRFGEDPRFAGSALRVDAKLLRDRPEDVLSPSQLARRHGNYRLRMMIGPSYRADLWAALEERPELSVTELARSAFSSIGAAWEAKHDFIALHGS